MQSEYEEIQRKRQALKNNIEKSLPSASFQSQGVFTPEEFKAIEKGYDIMKGEELESFVEDFNGLVRAGKVSEADYRETSKQIGSFFKATVTDGRTAKEFFVKKKVIDELEKASKGEGSKGGKVIGHTKSGKPVYAEKNADHKDYENFGHGDHLDAAQLHDREAMKTYDDSKGEYKQDKMTNHHFDLRDNHMNRRDEMREKEGVEERSFNEGNSAKRAKEIAEKQDKN